MEYVVRAIVLQVRGFVREDVPRHFHVSAANERQAIEIVRRSPAAEGAKAIFVTGRIPSFPQARLEW
jgi:hypothetical protein